MNFFAKWIAPALSILALLFTGLQWLDTHEQIQAAYKPLVDFDTEDDPDSFPFGISIENRGTGPAIIKSITYYVDGKPFHDVDAAVDAAKLKADETEYYTFDPDDSLGVSEKELLLFRLKQFRKDQKEAKRFANFLDDHLGIEVEFCSLTGECKKRCSTPGRCS
jgi:hypothetical protein